MRYNTLSDDNGSLYNGVVYDNGQDNISTNAKINDFDAVTIRAFQHQKLYEEAIMINDGLSVGTKHNLDHQNSTIEKAGVAIELNSNSNILDSDQKTVLVSHHGQ